MPGLFVILSLAAFAAMAAMNATSKTPSPGAPLPGAPVPDGDPPLGPAGPRLSSGKVTMPAGTKWMLDLTLNTPTTDRAAFEKFYASALAGQGRLLSTSWQDNQHLLTSVFVLQPQTLDLDSTLHDLFTVNSVQQMNTQLTLPSVTPSSNVPGTVTAKPGEAWLVIVSIMPAPGVALDKAALEKGLKDEFSSVSSNTTVNWIGNEAQVGIVVSKQTDIPIGKPVSTPTATLTITSASRVPGVV